MRVMEEAGFSDCFNFKTFSLNFRPGAMRKKTKWGGLWCRKTNKLWCTLNMEERSSSSFSQTVSLSFSVSSRSSLFMIYSLNTYGFTQYFFSTLYFNAILRSPIPVPPNTFSHQDSVSSHYSCLLFPLENRCTVGRGL